jgi:hypothetical protein
MKQQHDDYTAEREEQSPSPYAEDGNIFNVIRNMMNVASLLRVGGALIMLVAMSTYLMQGWSEGNDISRYYMLLSQTLALAAGGFGLSYLLKENKGARIFFGLGLISITVNMTTLGALIFSTMQWGSDLVEYPRYARWVAPEFGEIILALLGTIAISAPVAWIGHKVLARRSAGTLSALFLFTNLLLLIPVRESVFVGIAALIAVIIPIAIFSKRMSQENTLRTPEGLIGMATVLVPAGIIICRSIWFYPVDEILQIILSGTAFIALRFCAYQTQPESSARNLTYLLSLGAAFGVAMPAALLAQRYLPEGMDFNVFGIILAGLLLDISTRCHKPLATVHMAALILITSNILPVFMTDNISNGALCILAGLTTILLGYQHGLRYLIPLGLVTVLCGVGRPAIEFMQWLDFSNWITLSVTGGVVIITASLIERHGAYIKMKWDRLAKFEEE